MVNLKLDEESYNKLLEILNKEPELKPELQALLNKPSVFETPKTEDKNNKFLEGQERPTLEQVAWVFSHLSDALHEGSSYRHIIYDRLGFGMEAYGVLYAAGGMAISNALFDSKELHDSVPSKFSEDTAASVQRGLEQAKNKQFAQGPNLEESIEFAKQLENLCAAVMEEEAKNNSDTFLGHHSKNLEEITKISQEAGLYDIDHKQNPLVKKDLIRKIERISEEAGLYDSDPVPVIKK